MDESSASISFSSARPFIPTFTLLSLIEKPHCTSVLRPFTSSARHIINLRCHCSSKDLLVLINYRTDYHIPTLVMRPTNRDLERERYRYINVGSTIGSLDHNFNYITSHTHSPTHSTCLSDKGYTTTAAVQLHLTATVQSVRSSFSEFATQIRWKFHPYFDSRLKTTQPRHGNYQWWRITPQFLTACTFNRWRDIVSQCGYVGEVRYNFYRKINVESWKYFRLGHYYYNSMYYSSEHINLST